MQTLIQVVAKGSGSLREKIVNDPKLEDYQLVVVKQRSSTRPNGWAKVKCLERVTGAINISWNDDAKVLICRVVNKMKGKPDLISAYFVNYLLARHHARIKMIQIVPE